jgi:hypothetical protein
MPMLLMLGVVCAAALGAAVVLVRRRHALRAWEDELELAFARDRAPVPLSRSTLGATRGGPTSGAL